MLSEFRARSLTNDTDALPALSGLARDFGSRTGDTYIAGIWRKDIFKGLSWRRLRGKLHVPGSLDADIGGSAHERYESYIEKDGSQPQQIEHCFAPSWSWGSLANHRIKGTSWGGGDGVLPDSLCGRFVEAQITPSYSDKAGQIKYGKLVLEGACRKVTVVLRNLNTHHPYGQKPGIFIFEINDLQPKHLNKFVHPFIDHPSWLAGRVSNTISEKSGFLLTCFVLGVSNQLHYLLLYESGKENNEEQYRRCGILNINSDAREFSQNWERRRVVII
jgi:hypothetical protein